MWWNCQEVLSFRSQSLPFPLVPADKGSNLASKLPVQGDGMDLDAHRSREEGIEDTIQPGSLEESEEENQGLKPADKTRGMTSEVNRVAGSTCLPKVT